MRKLNNSITMALAGLLLATTGAFAAQGVATGAVNVRTGPGTSFSKVDTLFSGESVAIGECQAGWCYVEHDGPDGWVSANYLTPAGGSTPAPAESGDDCHFNWVVGRGFSIVCGDNSITLPTPGGALPPPPPTKKVCVYDGPNFSGAHVCANAGISDDHLGPAWNNRITSIRLFGGAKIKLCQNYNYGGFCNTFSSNVPMLGMPLNNKASSYKTW